MAIPFSFSYLPHCHKHSTTVGFSKEPELCSFFKVSSLHLYFFSPLLPFPSLSSQCAFLSHLLLFPFSHFHFLLMKAPSHISFPLEPLFSVPRYLWSSLCHMLPFSLSLCFWLECHWMSPGLRALEYRRRAAVRPGEDVREGDRPSSN